MTAKEKRILMAGGWLNDNLIDAASSLLRNEFPWIGGLRNACFSKIGFDYSPIEGVQIHHVNNSHWVLSSSIGGKIRLYDSLVSAEPGPEIRRQLKQLYSPDEGDVSFVVVTCQQQI